jgi:very-short-patch-repair endonuclease
LLAGPSAARSYGLWAGFDQRVHVSVGANSSRLRTNFAPSFRPPVLTPDSSDREIVVHWLVGGSVPEQGPECWRVPWPTCLQQVVSWCDRETAIACLDTALTAFHISRATLFEVFRNSSLSDSLLVRECRSGSDSGAESIVRQRLRAAGIRTSQQVRFPVGRVDMRVDGTRILIEVDGKAFHDSSDARERDLVRDAELCALNFVVIRLSYRRIFFDWDWCLRVIREAIRIR